MVFGRAVFGTRALGYEVFPQRFWCRHNEFKGDPSVEAPGDLLIENGIIKKIKIKKPQQFFSHFMTWFVKELTFERQNMAPSLSILTKSVM